MPDMSCAVFGNDIAGICQCDTSFIRVSSVTKVSISQFLRLILVSVNVMLMCILKAGQDILLTCVVFIFHQVKERVPLMLVCPRKSSGSDARVSLGAC